MEEDWIRAQATKELSFSLSINSIEPWRNRAQK